MNNNRCRTKICSLCGKLETNNWSHHWKVWHRILKKNSWTALKEGAEPQQSWCSNWRDVIDGAIPENVLP